MKKVAIISITLISSVTIFACGQENDVPQEVIQAFESRFEGAAKVKWENEKGGEWEAAFKMNNIEYSANFESNGEWIETEHEISTKDLPTRITTSLAKLYSDFDIEEAEVVESKEHGKAYEMEVEVDDNDMMIMMDDNGRIIKQQSEENEEDD